MKTVTSICVKNIKQFYKEWSKWTKQNNLAELFCYKYNDDKTKY